MAAAGPALPRDAELSLVIRNGTVFQRFKETSPEKLTSYLGTYTLSAFTATPFDVYLYFKDSLQRVAAKPGSAEYLEESEKVRHFVGYLLFLQGEGEEPTLPKESWAVRGYSSYFAKFKELCPKEEAGKKAYAQFWLHTIRLLEPFHTHLSTLEAATAPPLRDASGAAVVPSKELPPEKDGAAFGAASAPPVPPRISQQMEKEAWKAQVTLFHHINNKRFDAAVDYLITLSETHFAHLSLTTLLFYCSQEGIKAQLQKERAGPF